ncbi:homoserine dehydrogenase [Marinicauda algicola]|uniref:Homoserine dehydrogenase n=1 Tax=Marinicauda algicola TaxID=2029849 RepID=A0A4S2H2E7_9PROT|nr:homoserine dehydrogenase [Marinicauda algicola]TGY89342.1 homoserine dehydrogenase [Marinicauda algicola]
MASALADPEKASRLSVIKFGGSVLTCETDFRAAGAETYRHIRTGEKAIIIVSAIAGETDALLRQAEALGGSAADTARLVRLGEYRSAALMGLELARLGVRTRVLDPHEIGLVAQGDPLDADLSALDEAALERALDDADALVVPGFTAGHAVHGAATLGRGGTDLTAVFFAARTGADRVRLIKDVDGVYSEDPAVNPKAARYDALDYDAALQASRGLIQPKAIEAARAGGVVIEVAAMGAGAATRIAPGPASPGRLRHRGPMRVALLGCGAVGSGVLDYLRGHPELFELNPVLVRTPSRRRDDPRAAFTALIGEALDGGPDLVVELLGGADGPAAIMQGALSAGARVVTANKAAVARHYDALHAGGESGRLAYSAAVGGGVPVIEHVAALKSAGLASIEGVMNGTANFILDRLAAGSEFGDALAEAQRLGFAEADPSADVEGHDAADKLSILIREAFGVALPPDDITKQSLSEVSADKAAEAAARGLVYKQIGRCRLAGGRVEASVSVETVPAGHPLAGARNEENRFVLTDAAGRTRALYGKGAGRWPTAAAVFADIMDMRRAWSGDERVQGRATVRAAALKSA